MLQFSILGFLVSGAFLGRAYFDYFFTLVACVAILKRLCAFDRIDTELSSMPTEESALDEEDELQQIDSGRALSIYGPANPAGNSF